MSDKERSAVELLRYQTQYELEHSIGDLTPTICEICGVRSPAECGGVAVASVVDQCFHLTGGLGRIRKALLFCADACGEAQGRGNPESFDRIRDLAGLTVRSAAVMPSVTPVCYGTLLSGASPSVHGIKKYEKPVLSVETIFDVFAEAGRKTAIVAVNEDSLDTIFRRRAIDYYSFCTDEAVVSGAVRLIADGDYDLIALHLNDYDSAMHHTGVFSGESRRQMTLIADRFETVCGAVDCSWKNFNRVVAFLPDHGQHRIDETHGAHGENIPDDMIVNHYYRIRAAGEC